MASYLFPYVQNQLNPYVGPTELYGQALQVKDQKLRAGLANIRNQYDSILNMPLTNAQNQQTLRSSMQSAMERLSKAPITDVSLPENVASLESVFDPILNNNDLLYDTAWTRRHKSELNKAEALQKTKPELVPPQNLEPLYMAQRNYEQGDPSNRPGFTSFSPYYDFNSKMNTELDKVKADVDNQIIVGKGLTIQGPGYNSKLTDSENANNGSLIYIDNLSQQQLKEIKEAKVAEITWNRLHTDGQALNQMSLDYSYNMNHGLYSPAQANTAIDMDIDSLRSQIQHYITGMNIGGMDKSLGEAKVKGLNKDINDLVNLKNQIKIDPSKSKDYYTFNKTIKDYIEGKVSQYSYRDEGKLEDVPLYGKLRDYQFDLMKEQWKAKWETDKEATKAAAKLKATAAAIGGITPLKGLVISLEESPTGKVAASPTDIEVLGNFTNKNGKLYHSFAQSGDHPGNSLIIQPSSGELTPAQNTALNQAQVMYGLTRDLEKLGVTALEHRWVGSAGTGGGGGIMADVQTEQTGDTILKNIALNPNFYGKDTQKINDIVTKYSGILSQLKVDLKNPTSLITVQNAIKDPAIAKAMEFGQKLDKLNGDFQVATEGENVVKGESGIMYVKGKVIVPISHIGGSFASSLISANLATPWTAGIGSGRDSDDDSKYVKSNEPQIAINFYKPINGDMADLNDQMLMANKRLEGQGDMELPIREQSRKDMKEFYGLLRDSDNFQMNGIDFEKNSEGRYSLSQKTAANKPLLDNINRIAWDISVRTGLDPRKVQQDVSDILAVNPTPVRRAEAIRNYEINNTSIKPAPTSNPGFRSFGSYQEGRAALENQLELYKTGQTRNNVSPDSTLLQAMSVYAPSGDNNNPTAYTDSIVRILKAKGINVTPSTKISQIDIKAWADAIEIVEANTKGNNPGNLRP